MRVLHIATRPNVGGVSRWLRVLQRLGAGESVEHVVVVGTVHDGEATDLALLHLSDITLKSLGRGISLRRDAHSFADLHGVIREVGPDVVNTHMAKAGLLGRLASLSLGRRAPALVHTMHGHVITEYFARPKSWAVAFAERQLGSMTDGIIAVGSHVASDLVSFHVATREKINVIRPGLPDEEWLAREEARRVLGLQGGRDVIAGWLGRLVTIKRPERLLDIASRLPDVGFVVGGGGPLEEEFSRRAPCNVVRLGWVEPVPFWSACDLAVLTSDNEGIPTALVEASLAGLPSVTTRAGSVSDIVVDGVTGFVVERNAEAIAEAVRFLANDHDARLRMGQSARERALREFSPERMWAEHRIVYERALERRRGRLWQR